MFVDSWHHFLEPIIPPLRLRGVCSFLARVPISVVRLAFVRRQLASLGVTWHHLASPGITGPQPTWLFAGYSARTHCSESKGSSLRARAKCTRSDPGRSYYTPSWDTDMSAWSGTRQIQHSRKLTSALSGRRPMVALQAHCRRTASPRRTLSARAPGCQGARVPGCHRVAPSSHQDRQSAVHAMNTLLGTTVGSYEPRKN
jgi:hypothetical protein